MLIILFPLKQPLDTAQQSQLAAILGSDFPNSSAASLSGVSVASTSSSGIGTSRASSSSSKHEDDTHKEDEVFTRSKSFKYIYQLESLF